MRLINLTPHDVCIFNDRDCIRRGNMLILLGYEYVQPIAVFPSEGLARSPEEEKDLGYLECDGASIPLVETVYGKPVGLPEPSDGKMYIVSAKTAMQAQKFGRKTDDLVIPTGMVKNSRGEVISCTALSKA